MKILSAVSLLLLSSNATVALGSGIRENEHGRKLGLRNSNANQRYNTQLEDEINDLASKVTVLEDNNFQLRSKMEEWGMNRQEMQAKQAVGDEHKKQKLQAKQAMMDNEHEKALRKSHESRIYEDELGAQPPLGFFDPFGMRIYEDEMYMITSKVNKLWYDNAQLTSEMAELTKKLQKMQSQRATDLASKEFGGLGGGSELSGGGGISGGSRENENEKALRNSSANDSSYETQLNDELGEITSTVNDLEDDNAQLTSEIAELTKSLQKMKQSKQAMDNEHQKGLRNSNTNESSDYETRLNDEIDGVVSKVTFLEDTNLRLKSEAEELTKKLQKMQQSKQAMGGGGEQ